MQMTGPRSGPFRSERGSAIVGVTLAVGVLAVLGWYVAPRTAEPAQRDVVREESSAPPATAPGVSEASLSRAPEILDADAVRALAGGPPAPEFRILEGRIERGQALADSLGDQGVPARLVHAIASEMKPLINFRYSRPGDAWRLVQRADDELVEFRYSPSPLESYHLVREGDRYVTRKWEAGRERRTARVASVVTSSLYESIAQLGEDPELASDFADIFAWDVDFAHATQRGDEFSILYERIFRVPPHGEPVYEGPGRILAARYEGASGDHRAVYFEMEEGRGGYYRPDGTSVQRQFLKAPLSFRRISSRYTLARFHPILKIRRPHQGIDYAAAKGTPVWAIGDGKVTYRGWKGGFGNIVTLRHSNGIESHYGHLSRFASSLRVGQWVSQKQVVGYVGSTGLSTGPHLCFRMTRNGKYVNPASLITPVGGEPIPSQLAGRFDQKRDELLAALDPKPLAVTNEAL